MVEKLTKICSKCKQKKLLLGFYKDKTKQDGLNYVCKKCHRSICLKSYYKNRAKRLQQMKDYHKKHTQLKPSPAKKRKRDLKYKHGLTVKEYNQMALKQRGLCAICQQEETVKQGGTIRRLGVDHNHKTEKVRGLLCCNCNGALGLLKDNIKIVKRALQYLKKY